jgi:hypothetical protein
LPVRLGNWRNVGELIEFFVLNGCELRDLPGEIESPDGETHTVRYLYSPFTDDFASLTDLDNGDSIPEDIYRNWERRLGFKLP